VLFSPDGTVALAITYTGTSTALLHAASGTEFARLEPHRPFRSATFSPDGKRLLSYGADRTQLATGRGPAVRLLDLATGMELARMAHTGPVSAMVFRPDSALLATRAGRTVALWTT
jgi:WD40 repeat protein